MVFVSLFIMITSTLGYFGIYQFGCILALGLFQITKSEALAISLLIQFPGYLLNIVLGIITMLWEGVNFILFREKSLLLNKEKI